MEKKKTHKKKTKQKKKTNSDGTFKKNGRFGVRRLMLACVCVRAVYTFSCVTMYS